MSKKHSRPEAQPAQQQPAAVPPPAPAPQAAETVPNGMIWTFWIGVAVTVAAARALNYALPGISESVIERWVMLAFAAFLGVFLYKLK